MKILFLGAINSGNSPQGGEEYKNQLLINKFSDEKGILISMIDTIHWKKSPKVWFQIVYSLFFIRFDTIIISASSYSTYKLLQIIDFFKPSLLQKVHYFVIGGYLPEGIKTGKYIWEIYKNLNSVVVEGAFMKAELLKETRLKNILEIPNFKKFVQPTHDYKIHETFKFVYVGRISKSKGIQEILDAVKILNVDNSYLKFTVDFYGPIEDEFAFDEFSNVNYKGYLDLMFSPEKSYDILKEYSCMLFPTYWMGEGFPGVIIDAFVSGLPVIATNWNMNIEILENEKNGIIVPIKNSSELANAMAQLMNNEGLCVDISYNNFQKAADYHIDNIWPRILGVIK